MNLFQWSPQNNIGIAALDAQHREWFRRLGEFAAVVERGEAAGAVEKALRFALDYTDTHFRDEERYMGRIKYPGLETHRLTHQAFREQLMAFLGRIQKPDPVAALKLLSQWTTEHILIDDADFARHRSPHPANPSPPPETDVS